MQIIHPINKETIGPHCGSPVCVIMNDGSEIYGMLSCIEDGKLILNRPLGDNHNRNGNGHVKGKLGLKRMRGVKKAAASVSPSSYSPYPFPNPGVIALDLALISLLFVITFAW